MGVPNIIHGTITNTTGTCNCLPAALTFSFQPGAAQPTWDTGNLSVPGCSPTTTVSFQVECIGTTWKLFSTVCGLGAGRAADQAVCTPFQLTWNNLTCPGCCAGGTFTLTVTF